MKLLMLFLILYTVIILGCTKKQNQFSYQEMIEIYSTLNSKESKYRDVVMMKYNLIDEDKHNLYLDQLKKLSHNEKEWIEFLEKSTQFSINHPPSEEK